MLSRESQPSLTNFKFLPNSSPISDPLRRIYDLIGITLLLVLMLPLSLSLSLTLVLGKNYILGPQTSKPYPCYHEQKISRKIVCKNEKGPSIILLKY